MKMKLSPGNFLEDIISVLSSRFFVVVISFVSSVLIARSLGPENKGIVTAIVVVPNIILTFADLGIRQATTYYTGKKVYSDQLIISTTLFLSITISLVSVVIVIGFFVATGIVSKYGWYMPLLACMIVPFNLLNSDLSGVLAGKRMLRQIAFLNALPPTLNLFLLLPLLLLKVASPTTILITNVIASLASTFYVLRCIKSLGTIRVKYIPTIPGKFIKLGFFYALALFIISLNYRVDIILMERLSTTLEVGIYSTGVGIAELLWSIQAAFAVVNFSYSASSTDNSKKTVSLLKAVMWGSLIPLGFLYFLSPMAISLIYGEEFARSADVVRYLLPGIWVMSIFKILNSDLAGRGQPQTALWTFSLSLVLNIVLNLLWIPKYGALGGSWASSISYTIGALLFGVVYAKKSNVKFLDMFLFRKAEIKNLLIEKGA